ncbi:hypothetical protein EsH8_VII_000127 [Colletotrichum jinshuiense]
MNRSTGGNERVLLPSPASSPGSGPDRRRRTGDAQYLTGSRGARSSATLPPWVVSPTNTPQTPATSIDRAFKGGPIIFSSAQSTAVSAADARLPRNIVARSPSFQVSGSAQHALHRVLVLLAAYQAAIWAATVGSYVFQTRAETEGEEVYAYLAGVMRDVVEYRFVLLLGMAYGRLV